MLPINKCCIMDFETEIDPFAIHDKKKVKIQEFLVYLESEDGQDSYMIKKFENCPY